MESAYHRDKVMTGMLASLGIEKGKPYDPDEKTRQAMRQAAVDACYYMQHRFLHPSDPTRAGGLVAFVSPDLVWRASAERDDDGCGRDSRALDIGYRDHVAAILTLMIVLTLSLVVTRAATIALTATGMSREAARFQARSAFSGAGFTTTESESVVRHPVRRRIIMWLMLAGSAGIIAVIASVVLAATQPDDDVGAVGRVAIVCGSIVLIWWASRTRWVDERITRLATLALRRWSHLEVHDYAALLHVGGTYVVNELQVEADSWVAGRDLGSLSLRDEGIVVLGIERVDGNYLGVPTSDSRIDVGDVLVLYSRSESIAKLDRRQRGRSGDAAHKAAVREQAAVIAGSQAEPEDAEELNGSWPADK